MKNKTLTLLITTAFALLIAFAVTLIKDGGNENTISDSADGSIDVIETRDDSSNHSEDLTSIEISATETSVFDSEAITESSCLESKETVTESSEESLSEPDTADNLINNCKNIVSDGIYKLVITKQRRIGGLSLPIVTTYWFGKDYINIIEAETHNISTEIFINSNGAYMLNLSENSAYLMPTSTVKIPTINFKTIDYVSSGNVTIGNTVYKVEKYYSKENDTFYDLLFSANEIQKIKVYKSETDYELIGFELIDDISDGRNCLPQGIEIIDRR